MADQVVLKLHLGVLDLLQENELGRVVPAPAPQQYIQIPLLAERLGPGCPFPDLEAQSGGLPFPALELEGTVHHREASSSLL